MSYIGQSKRTVQVPDQDKVVRLQHAGGSIPAPAPKADMSFEELEAIGVFLNHERKSGWKDTVIQLTGTSYSTLQRWKEGQKIPTGHIKMLRMLNLIKRMNSGFYVQLLSMARLDSTEVIAAPEFDLIADQEELASLRAKHSNAQALLKRLENVLD